MEVTLLWWLFWSLQEVIQWKPGALGHTHLVCCAVYLHQVVFLKAAEMFVMHHLINRRFLKSCAHTQTSDGYSVFLFMNKKHFRPVVWSSAFLWPRFYYLILRFHCLHSVAFSQNAKQLRPTCNHIYLSIRTSIYIYYPCTFFPQNPNELTWKCRFGDHRHVYTVGLNLVAWEIYIQIRNSQSFCNQRLL